MKRLNRHHKLYRLIKVIQDSGKKEFTSHTARDLFNSIDKKGISINEVALLMRKHKQFKKVEQSASDYSKKCLIVWRLNEAQIN